jgi:hypothetical protein
LRGVSAADGVDAFVFLVIPFFAFLPFVLSAYPHSTKKNIALINPNSINLLNLLDLKNPRKIT